MKITIVGSSHGLPEGQRKCTTIMVEVGENVYFVDMGAPGADALADRGIPMEAVKGIFITHMHGDHTHGMIHFLDLITWYYKKADPVVYLPILEGAKAITAWIRATLNFHEREIKYRETKPGVVFDDGVIRMTAVPTKHVDRSYAYIMEAEGKTVVFSGDFAGPKVDFPVPDKNTRVDLLIGEGAHFDALDYVDALENCDVKRFCINHYATDMRFAHVLELQRILNEKGLPTSIATDGMVINL